MLSVGGLVCPGAAWLALFPSIAPCLGHFACVRSASSSPSEVSELSHQTIVVTIFSQENVRTGRAGEMPGQTFVGWNRTRCQSRHAQTARTKGATGYGLNVLAVRRLRIAMVVRGVQPVSDRALNAVVRTAVIGEQHAPPDG